MSMYQAACERGPRFSEDRIIGRVMESNFISIRQVAAVLRASLHLRNVTKVGILRSSKKAFCLLKELSAGI